MDQQPGMICVFQDITIQQRQNISSQINSSLWEFQLTFCISSFFFASGFFDWESNEGIGTIIYNKWEKYLK